MKRIFVMSAFIALVAGLASLRADDASSSPNAPEMGLMPQDEALSLWNQEHTAEIAKDPESAGVAAVIRASMMFQDKDPQGALDFFNRVLLDTHNAAVKRQIRLVLSDLYRKTNQQDKAIDQLQQLMME